MTPRDHAVSDEVELDEQGREAGAIAEYVSAEVRVLREAGITRSALCFDFIEDRDWTLGKITQFLASYSLRSGAYRCEIIREPNSKRARGLTFRELPE
jgi:hypothetical protein